MNEAIELLRQLARDRFYGAVTFKFEAGQIVTIKKNRRSNPTIYRDTRGRGMMKVISKRKSNDDCGRIDAIRKDSNMNGFEKWREIGEIIVRGLKQIGQLFDTPQGLFFFDSGYLRAFPLDCEDVGLAAIIQNRYGINPEEFGFDRVLANLKSEAFLNGRKIEIRRLAHYDRVSKRLYVSRFDGYMYRLDGDSVKQVENGTDDVFSSTIVRFGSHIFTFEILPRASLTAGSSSLSILRMASYRSPNSGTYSRFGCWQSFSGAFSRPK